MAFLLIKLEIIRYRPCPVYKPDIMCLKIDTSLQVYSENLSNVVIYVLFNRRLNETSGYINEIEMYMKIW